MAPRFDDYEDIDAAHERIGLSKSQLRRLCQQRRVPGAIQVAGRWFVPKDSWPEGRKHMGRPPTWERV